jgi:hypothetical protein
MEMGGTDLVTMNFLFYEGLALTVMVTLLYSGLMVDL